MMPPYVYEQARRNAPIHLQIRVSKTWPVGETTLCMQGRIVRIFRGWRQRIWPGMRIEIRIKVIPLVAESQPELGGTIYHARERFECARWIECFLERGEDGRLELILSQIRSIPGPSRVPFCGPDIQGFVP
jgi:hypothetical protein